MQNHDHKTCRARLALYLGVIQFAFALGWTVYVVYLPGLLAQVGIDKSWVIRILILDQLVFVVMDLAMGFAADRVRRVLGRLGFWLLGISSVSCLVFLLLPYLATVQLPGLPKPTLLLAAILLWAATASVLRAPPLVLLAQHARVPETPFLLACNFTGLALAGAASPYLGVALKNIDPQLPFALSALVLLATVAGLVLMERRLEPVPVAMPASPTQALSSLPLWFGGLVLLAAAAFQVFFFLNAARLYLRFAPAADLEWLMPVFWVGFNLSLFAAAPLARRLGPFQALGVSLGLGAGGALLCVQALGLAGMVAGQVLAGAAWGAAFMVAINLALNLGRTGREGRWLGLLFSLLAVGTIVRMLVVALDLPAQAAVKGFLPWLPVGLWAVAALGFGYLARTRQAALARLPA